MAGRLPQGEWFTQTYPQDTASETTETTVTNSEFDLEVEPQVYLPPGMSNGAGVEAFIPEPGPDVTSPAVPEFTKWPLESGQAERSLKIICKGIGLPETFTPIQVRDYLARNPELIRHMALNTLPDPRGYVEEGNFVRELDVNPRVRAKYVFFNMNQIIWNNEIIDSMLRVISSGRTQDVDTVKNIYRKDYLDKFGARVNRHYRETFPGYAELKDNEKEENLARIALGESGGLSQVMHIDDE